MQKNESIKLTRPQHDFIFTDAKFPALVGGLGSGKSQAGTFRTSKLMIDEGQGKNFAYYFPTYDLINLRGIPGLMSDLDRHGFSYTLNKSAYTVTVHGFGDVIFRSYDRPERIVAYEVAHSIVDELDTLPHDKAEFVWRKVVERNRQLCKHPHGNTVGCVTTPDQGTMGFVYEKWGQGLQDGYQLITASTYSNPFLPDDYIDNILKNYHPALARLYLNGEFVNLTGACLFDVESMLVDNAPVHYPVNCSTVFAVIDTAVKDGKEHDGTAVTYYSYDTIRGRIPLIILDWDIIQIEGALLETWLPSVFSRLEQLALDCGAIRGVGNVWIEDKASGSILIQQAKRKQLNVKAIPSGFSAISKSERAIAVSGDVYNGKVKFSEHAYNKTKAHKGATKNHLLTQVTGFRIGVDNKTDDLLDTFTYGLLLTADKKAKK